MQRIVGILTVLALAATAGWAQTPPQNFNPTGYPVVKEKITLTMMGSRHPFHVDWDKMFFFTDMEARTGIRFVFDTPPSTAFREKLNLAFSSGDLPDVLLAANLPPSEEIQYGAQKQLIPLENLIARYAPNIVDMFAKNPDAKKAITTPDGHIYALPSVVKFSISQAAGTMWVNGEWLRNLGITKLPGTVDELYALLKTFRDGDANKNGAKDEIPLSSLQLADLRPSILSAFGLLTGGIEMQNERALFAPIHSNYREYLAFMKKLWDERLLDPETYTQTLQMMAAKGKENRVGMFAHAVPSIAFKEDSVIHPVLPVLTSAVNQKRVFPINPGINRGAFAITSKNKHPEATIRWVDYCYTLDGSVLLHYSTAGKYWDWADEKRTVRKLMPLPAGLALGQLRGQFTPDPGNATPRWSRVEVEKTFANEFMTYRYKEVDGKLMPFGVVPFPLTYNTVDENKRILVLATDISTYVAQMEAKFVTGQEPLSQWDQYVATVKRMGVDELVSISQATYERWKRAQ